MSEATTARWRFRIGQRVRWGGARGSVLTVTQRRWIERQIMPPYAEYALQGQSGRVHWAIEADMTALAAGEGGG